jgi:hypothetical protein
LAVPANRAFAIATVLRKTPSSKAAVRAAIYDWTGILGWRPRTGGSRIVIGF